MVNGLDEMLTNRSTPAAARSTTGSRGYSRRGQKPASFQTSSQTVTPRRTPLNDDRRRFGARLEVAVLVEDVVGRQQRLPVPRDHAAVVTEDGRVEQGLALGRLVGLRAADQDPEVAIGQRGDAIAQRQVGVHEAPVVQQVSRRVPGCRELRQNQQVGAGPSCARGGIGNLLEVPVEGPDREVQLGEGESHVQLIHSYQELTDDSMPGLKPRPTATSGSLGPLSEVSLQALNAA